MTAAVVPLSSGVQVDKDAILRTLNLDPRSPQTQALLLVCDRYGLDPLLKHMVLIQGRPYVTRDGYLHIAHTSGALDGIEIVDEGEGDGHWWARVSVFRKDMGRAFTYKGRYPFNGGNKNYGPEMAIKCAEVAALRRAFNVTGIGAADEKWDAEDGHTVDAPLATPDALRALGEALTELGRYPDAYRERGYPPLSDLKQMLDGERVAMFADDAQDALELVLAEGVEAGEVGDREAPSGSPAAQPSPASSDVESGDTVTREGAGVSLPAGSPGSQDAAGAGRTEPAATDGGSGSAPADVPPLSDDERALAIAECERCGSKRAARVVGAGGKILCKNVSDCSVRASERAETVQARREELLEEGGDPDERPFK